MEEKYQDARSQPQLYELNQRNQPEDVSKMQQIYFRLINMICFPFVLLTLTNHLPLKS